jgi:hypothetical protein
VLSPFVSLNSLQCLPLDSYRSIPLKAAQEHNHNVRCGQGYESLAQEVLKEDQAKKLQQKKIPRSDAFDSREEALVALAKDVMRITGCTSLNLAMEMASELAKYKPPALPNWPKTTPFVS